MGNDFNRLPFLLLIHDLPVDGTNDGVDDEEEEELPADELVQGALPLEEEPGEAASGGAGDVTLVGNGHPPTSVLSPSARTVSLGPARPRGHNPVFPWAAVSSAVSGAGTS